MARKNKLDTTSLDSYGSAAGLTPPAKSKVNPASLKNLHPRKKGSGREKKYMQLDIYEFEDYLNRMAKYKRMTRTAYIQSLIRKDMEEHTAEYEALRSLPDFNGRG